MPNVIRLPYCDDPKHDRVFEPLTYDDFCIADAAGKWRSRYTANGMTFLDYPAMIMIMCPGGTCSVVRYRGLVVSDHIAAAMAAMK